MTIDATSWTAGQIGTSIASLQTPDLSAPWFIAEYRVLRGIGMMIALIGLLVSMLFAAAKRDAAEIGRTLVRLMTAGISTGLIIIFVGWSDSLIATLGREILGQKGDSSYGSWKELGQALTGPASYLRSLPISKSPDPLGSNFPLVMTELLALLMLAALVIIWGEMIVRSLCLDLCVLLWPLGVAGSVWTGARDWSRRLVHTIISLEAFPLFMDTDLRFAHDQLVNVHSATDCVKGIGLLWLGAAGPFFIMRLVGFTDGAIQPGHTGEGLRQMGTAAAVGAGMRLAGAARSGAGAVNAAVRAGGATPMPPVRGPRDLASEGFQHPTTFAGGGATPPSGGGPGHGPKPPPPPPPPPPTPRPPGPTTPPHTSPAPPEQTFPPATSGSFRGRPDAPYRHPAAPPTPPMAPPGGGRPEPPRPTEPPHPRSWP